MLESPALAILVDDGLFEGDFQEDADGRGGKETLRMVSALEDSSISSETPSLRRRLDAAFEHCNRTVASWIGEFWDGLFNKK